MKNPARKFLLYPLAGLVLLVLLLLSTWAALPWVVDSDWAQGRIRLLVEEKVEPAAGFSLRFDRLRMDRLTRLTVEGLALSGDGGEFLSVASVSTGPLIPGILDVPLDLGEVVLEGLSVTLSRNASGAWNLPTGRDRGAGQPSGKDSGPLTLPVTARVRAGDGKLLARLEPVGEKPGLHEDGTFSFSARLLPDRVEVERFAASLAGLSLELDQAMAAFSGDALAGIVKARAESLASLAALVSGLPPLADLAVEAKMSGSVSAPQAGFSLSAAPGQSVEGTIRAGLAASPPTASLSARFVNLATASFSPLTATVSGAATALAEGDSLSRASLSLALFLDRSVIRGVRVEEGSLEARVEDLVLVESRAGAKTPGGAFALTASGSLAGLLARSQAASLSLVLEARDLDPTAWGGPEEAAGSLEVRVTAQGDKPAGQPLARASATGRAEFSGAAGRFSVRDGGFGFSAGPGGLEVWDGRLAWQDGTLAFSGRREPGGDLLVNAAPDIRDLASLTGLFLTPPVQGVLSGQVMAQGPPLAPRVFGQLSGSGLIWKDFAARDISLNMDGDLGARSGALEVSASHVRAGGARLASVRASVSGDGARADFHLALESEISGLSLAVSGEILGLDRDIRDIRAEHLGVTARDLAWEGSARMAVGPDRVEIQSLDLAGNGPALSVSGWAAYTGALSVALAAWDIRLDDMALRLAPSQKIQGLAWADLRVENSLAEPRMELSAGVDGLWVKEGLPRAGVELSASYESGAARVRAEVRPEGGGMIKASGAVPLSLGLPLPEPWLKDSGLDLAVTAQDLPLGFMAGLTSRVEELLAVAGADLTLTGDPRAPAVAGRVEISGERLALAGVAEPFRDLSADLSLDPGGVTVHELFARLGETGSLTASGSFGTGGGADLTARVQGLDLLPWTRGLLPGPELSGTAGAEISLSGSPAAPVVRILARVEGLGPPDRPEIPASDLSVDASYAQGLAEFSGRLAPRSGGDFTVRGSLPLTLAWPLAQDWLPGQGLETDIRGNNLSLAFLPAWIKAVENTDAVLELTARISGVPRSPAFSGEARVQGGKLALAGREEPLTALSARLAWDSRNRIRLEDFSARSGDRGTIQARGSLDLTDGRPESVEASLSCKDLEVSAGGLATAWMGADLAVRGPLPGAGLTGQVRVGKGEFRLEKFLESRARRVTGLEDVRFVGEEKPRPAPKPELFRKAAMDVNIRVDGPFWVRGAGAQVELGGEFRAVKPPEAEDLSLGGHLDSLRGFYTFSGRTFEVRPGRVIFTGRKPPDPNLDIPAAYRVADATVLLHIGGSASSPSLTLSGDPPMGETEAMSYLMFGKPPDRLSGGQSASLQQQAMGFFGSRVIDELRQYLGQEVPLDLLTLEKGSGQESGAQVVMGKYINPDLFVTYRRGVGGEGGNEVRLEYSLSPHVSIQSQVSETESGADLFFVLDY